MADIVSKLKSGAAAVFVAAAATLPGNLAIADDTPDQQFAAAASTNTPQLTEEQRARLEVIGEAMDYAATGYGKIGVSVLHGADLPQLSGDEIAEKFSNGIGKNFTLPAQGYAGDNGEKATEVTFTYLLPPRSSNEEPIVMASGPHNLDEALVAIHDVGLRVQGISQNQGLNVDTVNYEQ